MKIIHLSQYMYILQKEELQQMQKNMDNKLRKSFALQ